MPQADSGIQPQDGVAGPGALEISGVSKSYGGVRVLNDINLTISRGQVLGLLGSNGAGKSTLLNIIAGSVPASSGMISFGDETVPVASYGVSDAAARGVACVYQELSLFPNLTVAENFRMARPGDAGQTRRQTAAATQAAAQVTFYQGEGFRGRSFTADRPIGNLERQGFNDRASSAVVDGGAWQVCEDARFSGRCVVLRPGQYDSLRAMGLDNEISSVRPVDHYAAGGRTIATGDYAGIGRDNPNKSSSVRGFALTKDQRADLIAFLHSLTDEALLNDPRFGNPWVRQSGR